MNVCRLINLTSLAAKSIAVLALCWLVPATATAEVVLWNKLGSEAEVLSSEIGPSFEIVEQSGHVLFAPLVDDSVFGGAVATSGGTGASTAPAGGYLAMNPDDFFPADKTRGTVEFWAQKRFSRIHPYGSPLVTFFGPTYFSTGYYAIFGMWTNTPYGLSFNIYDGTYHSAIDPSWEEVDVGQWVHLAFVWDGSGIEGGPDDLRIYRDGVLVASHQGTFSQVVPRCCIGYSCGESQCGSGGYELRVLANHQGQRFTDCSPYLAHGDECLCDSSQYPSGYCPPAYMDNLVVWDYAKTDFSDRFAEDGNTPPTAVAGADQSIHAGATVYLDGTGSYDAETATEDLEYAWSFTARPEGSAAVLDDPTSSTPSFVADLPGDFVVSLVVTDEGGLSGPKESDPDEVLLTSLNAPPTAVPGPDQATYVGDPVLLDGSASYDPDDDPITFAWTLSAPEGSQAVLEGAETATPSFVPDVPGTFIAELVVSDGFADSDPTQVEVVITTPGDYAQEVTAEVLTVVADLDLDQVSNSGNQQALTNVLKAAIDSVQKDKIEHAKKKLRDALETTDGVVLRGEVDAGNDGFKKDTITDPELQVVTYWALKDALEALE